MKRLLLRLRCWVALGHEWKYLRRHTLECIHCEAHLLNPDQERWDW